MTVHIITLDVANKAKLVRRRSSCPLSGVTSKIARETPVLVFSKFSGSDNRWMMRGVGPSRLLVNVSRILATVSSVSGKRIGRL